MPTIINLTTYHLAILQILAQETKPLSSKALHDRVSHNEKLSRFVSRLTITKVIHDLHINHIPICQNSKGYFYAREIKDLNAFILKFEKKIRKDQKELAALRESFNFIGYYDTGKFVMMVDLPVRTELNTVRMHRFECDESGRPKVPEGITLMR